MSFQTAHSSNPDPEAAAAELAAQLTSAAPGLLIYFASPRFDPAVLTAAVARAFPGTPAFGCTTAGEIVTGRMLKQSVVAMAIGADVVSDVAIEVVPDISHADRVAEAFARFADHFGEAVETMGVDEYVGIVLFDGLRAAEERLMDRIGDLTNVMFVGASAGDDVRFERTHVFADGRAYTDAALLALLRPSVPFELLKVQSFCSTGKKLVATRVDEPTRTVIEFDGRPAVESYAEAVAVSPEKVETTFMTNPVGLMIGDEPYGRSPQRTDDGRMIFFCGMKEGMELDVLESTDIVQDTRRALDEQRRAGTVSGIVNFNCILRTMELDATDQAGAYGELFADTPTIGFSTYGEEFIGHMNQTATMLLFR